MLLPGDPQPRRRARTSTLVQGAGLLVGVALLSWCISIALRPENRSQLQNLASARPSAIAGLLALSLVSLLANGGVFWSLVRPVQTLPGRLGVPFWHMQSVNAVATCLAYVPFKLSIVFRIFVHRTQDGVRIGTIAAWIAAAASSLVAVCGPVLCWALLGFSRGPLVLAWLLSALAISAVGWRLARGFAGPAGLATIRSAADRAWPRVLGRLARTALVEHLHAGFDMVGSASGWFAAIGFRTADVSIQAIRFWVAAQILGLELDLGSALVLGAVYYSLGAASPSGALGIREGGATGVAKLMELSGGDTYAAVTLLVTAADAIPTIASAIGGLLVVRPWRIGARSVRG